MTLDEAIKNKEEDLKRRRVYYDPNLLEADRLSIEALKRERANRLNPHFVIVGLLPGETEK